MFTELSNARHSCCRDNLKKWYKMTLGGEYSETRRTYHDGHEVLLHCAWCEHLITQAKWSETMKHQISNHVTQTKWSVTIKYTMSWTS